MCAKVGGVYSAMLGCHLTYYYYSKGLEKNLLTNVTLLDISHFQSLSFTCCVQVTESLGRLG